MSKAKLSSAFSQAALNEIFKISPKRLDCVNSRESSGLEFKQSFGWGSIAHYSRTCAAFANVRGGYVVFGIGNRPHRMVGLKKRQLDAFEQLDPERLTGFFNDHFAPEIRWEVLVHEVSGKQFGLLYVHQGTQRPVFCIRDAGSDLKEGDIYYRYRGRTTRVKYPELRSIIEEQRQRDQKLWLQHLAKISRVGVRDAGIFSLKDGKVTGPNGTFVIDESLLSQLAFIKEGSFTESKGRPAVRLVGEVKAVSGPHPAVGHGQVIRTKGIRLSDIVLAFLDHQKLDDPAEYIRQICFETTAFLPVYYFMNKAKIDIPGTTELIEGVLSRSPARKKLQERIQSGKTQKESPPSEMAPTYEIKTQFIADAKKHRLNRNLQGSDLKYCLVALRSLDASTVKTHSKYLRGLLKEWFNKHYMSADGYIVGNLRRTICWLDEALYLESVK